MKILLKYPTRGRPQQFLTTLKGWLDQAANPAQIAVLVSYDEDDATMTPEVIAQAEAMHPAVVCVRGKSESKIAACNRDLNEYDGEWDVVLLCSDDMWCRRTGWDNIIREKMTASFPDTDGALWFYDSSQNKINTLECVGRKRWSFFGYLYHESYFSFFCDNEQTDVGIRDKKLIAIMQPICSHEHPCWAGGMRKDNTYDRNSKYWKQDESNYAIRKRNGFPR